jgi:hypothetical protein
VITLEISDPSDPQCLGRTAFGPGEEGNAHSAVATRADKILIQADEDFSPFGFMITSSAFGRRRARRPRLSGWLDLPRKHRGSLPSRPPGKIAVIERGDCSFDQKIGLANVAGAIAAIVYNSAAGGEGTILMTGNDRVTLPRRDGRRHHDPGRLRPAEHGAPPPRCDPARERAHRLDLQRLGLPPLLRWRRSGRPACSLPPSQPRTP